MHIEQLSVKKKVKTALQILAYLSPEDCTTYSLVTYNFAPIPTFCPQIIYLLCSTYTRCPRLLSFSKLSILPFYSLWRKFYNPFHLTFFFSVFLQAWSYFPDPVLPLICIARYSLLLSNFTQDFIHFYSNNFKMSNNMLKSLCFFWYCQSPVTSLADDSMSCPLHSSDFWALWATFPPSFVHSHLFTLLRYYQC